MHKEYKSINDTKLFLLIPVLIPLITTLLFSFPTSADTEVIDKVQLKVPIACTLGGVGMSSHNATINPGTYSGASGSEYEAGIGKTTLTAFCNDVNGFAIYAIGFTGNSYASEDHTKLVGANTNLTIDTKVYASGDTDSNWSMKLTKVENPASGDPVTYNPNNMTITNSFNNWHAVPDTYVKVAEYHSATEDPSTTDTTLGAKLETTYATYISSAQPADSYTGQVKYVMVHPYNAATPIIPVSIAEATTLQEVNVCPDTLTTGETFELEDSRDGTSYLVTKLADNNCWMLDNLALDLTNSTVLNSMNSTNTHASDEVLNYLKGITTRNPATDPEGPYATAGVSGDYQNNNTYSAPVIATGLKNTVNSEDALSDAAKTWKYGIYYNYCAASAGSFCYGNGTEGYAPDELSVITNDICPSGWKIPTGGFSGDYPSLYRLSDYNSYSKFREALHLPLAGSFYNGTMTEQGQSGYYFTSRPMVQGHSFAVYFTTSSVYQTSGIARSSGTPIRCRFIK